MTRDQHDPAPAIASTTKRTMPLLQRFEELLDGLNADDLVRRTGPI
jgi:hypothetical protein